MKSQFSEVPPGWKPIPNTMSGLYREFIRLQSENWQPDSPSREQYLDVARELSRRNVNWIETPVPPGNHPKSAIVDDMLRQQFPDSECSGWCDGWIDGYCDCEICECGETAPNCNCSN